MRPADLLNAYVRGLCSLTGARAGRVVDVRVVAATNRDLLADMGAGRFRADLYHRLNVVRLEIPPLRARPDDVLQLAHHFRETYSLLYGRGPFSFSPEAEAMVVRHDWPGNVRELENRIMRAVILCPGSALTPADSFADLRAALGREIEGALAGGKPLPPLGRWLADDLVLEADVVGGGVGSRSAAILGIPEDDAQEAARAGSRPSVIKRLGGSESRRGGE